MTKSLKTSVDRTLHTSAVSGCLSVQGTFPTEGAFRKPMTYDNHPIPIPSSVRHKASKSSEQDPIRSQRESFFQSGDENENFSDSISLIETRPKISDT